eukprot:TRINITY_DN91611_c0_g1_i1.p1 TRINITY_DN91611_c0_g1~~TRINITY_DN91611_c0_g1_i1.p1  ORF type:complete len:460 (+),score=91.06 TRINITY_DN91611_c0_g1_i1:13-1392(+)
MAPGTMVASSTKFCCRRFRVCWSSGAALVAATLFAHLRGDLARGAAWVQCHGPRERQGRTALRAASDENPIIDVRKLLENAGLISRGVETIVEEGDPIEFQTPMDALRETFEEQIIPLRLKTVAPEIPEDEEPALTEFETPLSWLFQGAEAEEEGEEAAPSWLEPLLPLVDGDAAFVDATEESNYVTVSLEKPLGIRFAENENNVGCGVEIFDIQPGSNAERSEHLQSGYQLIVAGGVPVHGLPLEDAIKPIQDGKERIQLTFFKGGAELFYGLLGPSSSWLSTFLKKLQVQHLAWEWQEGLTPQGNRTWTWALELLDELQDSTQGKPLDTATYTCAYGAAIEACQKASRWEPALELLEQTRRLDLPPSAASYAATIISCDRGGQSLRTLRLLDKMLEVGLEPDSATYVIAANACRAMLRRLRSQASTMSVRPEKMTRRQRERSQRRERREAQRKRKLL